MLLSLRSNSQIQKYLYKMVMVCMQAVSITYITTLIYLYLSINTDFYMIYDILLETIG